MTEGGIEPNGETIISRLD